MKQRTLEMLDFSDPEAGVEVKIAPGITGLTLWVNVDGICRLRISRIDPVILELDVPSDIL